MGLVSVPVYERGREGKLGDFIGREIEAKGMNLQEELGASVRSC